MGRSFFHADEDMTTKHAFAGSRFVGLAMLAASLAGGAIPGEAQATETISMGVIGIGSAQQWALWIADAKGFFAQNNLKVEIVVTPSAAAVMQQIIAGSVQIGTAGLTSPMRAIDQGIPVAVLAIETQAPPYSLWSKPGLKSISELRGKTIVVGGAKDITRTYLERMVIPGGVPKDTYDLIYAGSASARFTSLRAALPMNLKAHFPKFKIWSKAQADIERITEIWSECLSAYGGPWLLGEHLTMADAMYAPVVTRLRTYDVRVDPVSDSYCDRILAWPAMQEWIAAAQREHEEIEELEV